MLGLGPTGTMPVGLICKGYLISTALLEPVNDSYLLVAPVVMGLNVSEVSSIFERRVFLAPVELLHPTVDFGIVVAARCI